MVCHASQSLVRQNPMSLENGKIGKVPNISLTPVASCPNHKWCANYCYALNSYFQYPYPKCPKGTMASWDGNFRLYRNAPQWYFNRIGSLVSKMQPKKWKNLPSSVELAFRWHVGGDIPDQRYLEGMKMLARMFPSVQWLAFTKSFHLDFRNKPRNLQIIFSIFFHQPLPQHLKIDFHPTFAWVQNEAFTEKRIPPRVFKCFAQTHEWAKCTDCMYCWRENKPMDVLFMLHGATLGSVRKMMPRFKD
jgi:hypothetical protein